MVPVGQLVHFPGNPRRHDLAVLTESLQRYGQTVPLVVQRGTDVVLKGNGTLDALVDLGVEEAAVRYVDTDDDESKRLMLMDNRASDKGGYDVAALAAQLQPLPDLAGTGYTADDVDDLVAQLGALPAAAAAPANDPIANEQRADPKPPLAKSGLKEVILVLRTDELKPFEARIGELAEKWNTQTVTATVLEAVRRSE